MARNFGSNDYNEIILGIVSSVPSFSVCLTYAMFPDTHHQQSQIRKRTCRVHMETFIYKLGNETSFFLFNSWLNQKYELPTIHFTRGFPTSEEPAAAAADWWGPLPS